MSAKSIVTENRCATCKYLPKNDKNVRINENPEASNSLTPSWCFNQMDTGHPRWNPRKIKHRDMVEILIDFEGLTWQEIICAPKAHGEGSKSHPVSVASLSKAAQKRLHHLNKDDIDEIYSLRLGGTKRLYGIRQQRTFVLIWYDSTHEIYPLKKK